MRELESGFWESIGNRNLYVDLKGDDGFLPYRYDVLDGSKLRDYEPITRFINAILPVGLNQGTNPTRELLFRSGLNFKQTFNSGPQGQDLEGHPDLKSKFQFYMGQQNIEAQLEELFKNEQVVESILTMERHRSEGRQYDPSKNLHGDAIASVFRTAKTEAWNLLLANNKKAQQIDYLHEMGRLQDKARRKGDYKLDTQLETEIQEFEKQMKVK